MDSGKFQHFIARMVPQGTVIYLGRPKGDTFIHDTYTDPVQAAAAAARTRPDDLYYGIAGYASEEVWDDQRQRWRPSRTVGNVKALQVLAIDIDADGRHYDDKRAAGAALKAWIAEAKLPPPTDIVDSGGGYHVYWRLDRTLTVEEWTPLAAALKQCGFALGLRADHKATANAALVLRPPGSLNTKRGVAATWVYTSGSSVQVDAMRAILRPHMVASVGPVDTSGIGKPAGAFQGAASEPGEFGPEWDDRPKRMALIKERCGVVREALASGGAGHSEPLWYSLLVLAAHAADGEQYVHGLSQGHAGYTPEGADRKFAQAQRAINTKGIGPTVCATFEPLHAACGTCPFKGRIRTPLQLGVNEEAVMPHGFKMEDRRLYHWQKDDDPPGWKPTLDLPLFDLHIEEDDEENLHLSLSTILSGRTKTILVPFGYFEDPSKMRSLLSSKGIIIGNYFDQLRLFMKSFSELLQSTKKNLEGVRPWGWNDGRTAFGLGDVVFEPGGRESPAPTVAGRAFRKVYSPHGDPRTWRQAADAITVQNHPPLVAILAASFAAPLLGWTGQNGTIVSATSRESGHGKSSAMRVSAAVWGHPVLSMSSLNDTHNAVAKRLGQMGSLPAYWDELRHQRDMEAFAQLAFRVGQGKDKARLTKSTDMDTGNTWETMMCVASNVSLLDYMGVRGGGEAGLYRVLEWYVTKPSGLIRAVDLDVSQSYGHAGRQYARWLVDNRETAQRVIRELNARLTDNLQKEPAERFWVASITALLAGAMFANRAGVVDIDMHALQTFLVRQLGEARHKLHADTTQNTSPEEVLAEYIRSISHRIVHTREMRPVGKRGKFQTSHYGGDLLPRGEVVAHVAHSPPALRIAAKPFMTYLTTQGESATHTIRHLQSTGVLSEGFQAVLGAGSELTTNYRTYCYDVLTYNPDV